MRALAAVLLIVGALCAVGFARHEDRVQQQDELAAVAGVLAGRPVHVHCPSFLGGLVNTRTEAGRVQFDGAGHPADTTGLSPETCKALRHLGRVDFTCLDHDSCTFAQFKGAWAAHTLAHESFHLRGIQSEAVAECYALQNTAFVAERLGVPARQAQELQRWVYVKGYPNEPDEYRSDECADGGTLDLRPETSSFP